MTAKARTGAASSLAKPLQRLIRISLPLLTAGVLGGVLWWQAQDRQTAPVGRLSGDFHALRMLPEGRLLYGQHAGIAVSPDEGRSWGPPNDAGDAIALATSPLTSDTLVMAGHDVLNVSQDGGETWQAQGFGNLPSTDIHGFAVAPSRQGVWYANIAGRGLYRTENAQDWQFVSPATANAMTLAVGPGSPPRLYALTMDAGLIVSDDGTTWQRAGEAPPASGSGLDVHPMSGHVYIAGPAGVARSDDQGATWTNLNLPEGALLVTSDPQEENKLYAVGESGLVYRSADGGRAWSK